MNLKLRYFGDPCLRKKAIPVVNITDELQSLIDNMIEIMDAHDGVGLAANQVGSTHKLFIIRPEIKLQNGEYALGSPEVFINPSLSHPSKELEVMTEGCLSFPGLHIEIERPVKIHVEALDRHGKKISMDVTGFKAREIMHENDHLNGKLFIDRIPLEIRKNIEPALKEIKAR